jgi:hypothetical protein
MTISEQDIAQVIRLIDEGERLNPFDLEAFYAWVEAAYEALKFHPVQKQRFDEYCRSSCDSPSMRRFVGLWMLKLALDEVSAGSRGCQDPLASNKSMPPPPGSSTAGSRRRR